jgi:hypothetical protein
MNTEVHETKLPYTIESIKINYDGGRFYVSINGEDFYINRMSGNDFSLEITKTETTFTDFD